MLIGGIMVMLVAIVGMVVAFSGVIESTYMSLAFKTPKFDYSIVNGVETGNEMFEVYKTMRLLAGGLFAIVLIFAGLSRILESTDMGIIQHGRANSMISKSLLFLIVIFVFPPMWDIAADGMENISYWVLNPLYSFDENNPCPVEWGTVGSPEYVTRLDQEYDKTPYLLGWEQDLFLGGSAATGITAKPPKLTLVSNSFNNNVNNIILIFDDNVKIEDRTKFDVNGLDMSTATISKSNFKNLIEIKIPGTKITGIITVTVERDGVSGSGGKNEKTTHTNQNMITKYVTATHQKSKNQIILIFSGDVTSTKDHFTVMVDDEKTTRNVKLVDGGRLTDGPLTSRIITLEYNKGQSMKNVEVSINTVDADGNAVSATTNVTPDIVGRSTPSFGTTITNAPPPRDIVCEPKLKVNYIFKQMVAWTDGNEAENIEKGVHDIVFDPEKNILQGTDWIGNLQDDIQSGATNMFLNLFLGFTKALVAIQILIMAIMIGIMTDLLVGMVAAALPVFMMMSLIPKADELANRMINALPALLLIPLMSAVIIVVGAAAIVEADIDKSTVAIIDANVEEHIYTWITAIGVVFFAMTLPILLVPLLQSTTQMATQIVSSAASTGAMVTGMAASSMTTAMTDRYSALKQAKGKDGKPLGMGAKMASIFGAGAAGLGSGFLNAQSMNAMPSLGTGAPAISGSGMANAIQRGIDVGHNVDPTTKAKLADIEHLHNTNPKKIIEKLQTPHQADKIANVTGDERFRINPNNDVNEERYRIDKLIREEETEAAGDVTQLSPEIRAEFDNWGEFMRQSRNDLDSNIQLQNSIIQHMRNYDSSMGGTGFANLSNKEILNYYKDGFFTKK